MADVRLPVKRPGVLGSIFIAVVIGMAVLSLATIWPASTQDYALLKPRRDIQLVRDGKAKIGIVTWAQLRNTIDDALAHAPENGQLREDMGFLMAYRALDLTDPDDLAARIDLLDEASKQYRLAIRARPMFAYSWAHLALSEHFRQSLIAVREGKTTPGSEELWAAYDNAFAFGQREPEVQELLAQIGFGRWIEAGKDRQQALRLLVLADPPRLQAPLRQMADNYGVHLPTAQIEDETMSSSIEEARALGRGRPKRKDSLQFDP